MPKESGTNKWLWFYMLVAILIAQLPSACIFSDVSEMQEAIRRYDEILALETADRADIEFVAQLKREANLNQDVQIVVGPYKRMYGDTFRYRLERHLVFAEQSLVTKETFLILFDKTFYHELDREKRKAVLAHEMWHVFSLANGKIRPELNEELAADNYASQYVSPEVLIELYEKYEGDSRRREAKKKNLKFLSQSQ